MAQSTLNQEDVKVLDSLRQRISQLTNNIASLKSDVLRSNPLPPWYIDPETLDRDSANMHGFICD